MSDDFSSAKRGSMVRTTPNKSRITIRNDADVIEHCKKLVHAAGGGSFNR